MVGIELNEELKDWMKFYEFVFGSEAIGQGVRGNSLLKNDNLTQYKQPTQVLHKLLQTTLKDGVFE